MRRTYGNEDTTEIKPADLRPGHVVLMLWGWNEIADARVIGETYKMLTIPDAHGKQYVVEKHIGNYPIVTRKSLESTVRS